MCVQQSDRSRAADRRLGPALAAGAENSLFDGPELVRVTAPRPTKVLGRHGLTALLPPAATLTIAPPGVVGERAGWQMRCAPYSGEGTAPDWLGQPSDRPRIVVSRSTVAGPGGGNLMNAVVAAAAEVPDNVRTVGWVLLTQVLPSCAGIVHHGGAGAIFAALAAGVPQLVVPRPGDRRHNGELVAARGAGLAVAERDITSSVLGRLVADPALASAAAGATRDGRDARARADGRAAARPHRAGVGRLVIRGLSPEPPDRRIRGANSMPSPAASQRRRSASRRETSRMRSNRFRITSSCSSL